MWFDVGFKTYTTYETIQLSVGKLWFDVGFKTYTTKIVKHRLYIALWFDVGFKTYTTETWANASKMGCGLM